MENTVSIRIARIETVSLGLMPSASAFSRDMTTTADAASFRLEELSAVTVPVPSNTKAAWQMAKAASDELGDKIRQGIVITKHGYSMGSIGNLRIREAGHPVPDGDSYSATREALDMVRGLTAEDTVLFLVSGGGSALFESPLIPEGGLEDITRQLLACGADITEMNVIRKRLSDVKGGRFALHCAPARVLSVVLSDVLGDPLDMIASGPAYPDSSTPEQAMEIVKKYGLRLSEDALETLALPTPSKLENVQTQVTGSVSQLCRAAEETCRELGIQPIVLTDSLCCTARDAGSMLGSIARFHRNTDRPLAFLMGGETVVRLTGHGIGGRNQELALAAAPAIAGIPGAAVFSVGSDGTDGPTDAAGGYVDGATVPRLAELGICVDAVLRDNDSYHALQKTGGLIVTGPTGTNVNDLTVLLLIPQDRGHRG